MIGFYKKALKPVNRLSGGRNLYSTSVIEKAVDEGQVDVQKHLREKALAEALAREEELIVKEKALRELKERSRSGINILNLMPTLALDERLKHLQSRLNSLQDQGKVKQLDEELEEFLMKNARISKKELGNRPWAESLNTNNYKSMDEEPSTQEIKTTTNNELLNQFPNMKPTPDYKPYSEQELYLRHVSHMRHSGLKGTLVKEVYNASEEVSSPKQVSDLTISELMAAGCHLGHAKALWRPSTQPFIYGEYDGIHLIDLNETISSLKRAAGVVRTIAKKGGVILYVGTSRLEEQQLALEAAAKRSNGYYVSHRWIPGTITNFTEISKQVGGEQKVELNLADERTDRIIKSSEDSLIKPDLIVLLNPVENRNCIGECIKSRIPTIGLCDTNMEPSLLTYPIPCNDDSVRSTSLVLGVLSKAAEEGFEERRSAYARYKSS